MNSQIDIWIILIFCIGRHSISYSITEHINLRKFCVVVGVWIVCIDIFVFSLRIINEAIQKTNYKTLDIVRCSDDPHP